MNKLTLYMIRWQLSTPVLAIIAQLLHKWVGLSNYWLLLSIGNAIGALLFYKFDQKIHNGTITSWIKQIYTTITKCFYHAVHHITI